ncbi:MAG: hypothetical protein JSS53_03830 [Proteobacteria bacterium]|nr:hypothetical protein [Pseudomonadota bacterium]
MSGSVEQFLELFSSVKPANRTLFILALVLIIGISKAETNSTGVSIDGPVLSDSTRLIMVAVCEFLGCCLLFGVGLPFAIYNLCPSVFDCKDSQEPDENTSLRECGDTPNENTLLSKHGDNSNSYGTGSDESAFQNEGSNGCFSRIIKLITCRN